MPNVAACPKSKPGFDVMAIVVDCCFSSIMPFLFRFYPCSFEVYIVRFNSVSFPVSVVIIIIVGIINDAGFVSVCFSDLPQSFLLPLSFHFAHVKTNEARTYRRTVKSLNHNHTSLQSKFRLVLHPNCLLFTLESYLDPQVRSNLYGLSD